MRTIPVIILVTEQIQIIVLIPWLKIQIDQIGDQEHQQREDYHSDYQYVDSGHQDQEKQDISKYERQTFA